jgi:hypothetical protein
MFALELISCLLTVVSSCILKSIPNYDYTWQKTNSFDGMLNNMWYIPSS